MKGGIMDFASNLTRDIEIKTTGNAAYLVHVGCQYFAYTDVEKLIADLSEYLRDPKGVEEQYNKHFKAYDEEPRSPGSLSSSSSPTVSEHAFVPEPEQPDESPEGQSAEDLGY